VPSAAPDTAAHAVRRGPRGPVRSIKSARRAVDAAAVSEALLVLGAVATLAGMALLAAVVDPDALLRAGAWITLAGLVTGVPAGGWYHLVLYRALRARGPLPARWWLRPVDLHVLLGDPERGPVLRWFALGGLGFAVVVIGCAVLVLGLLALLSAAPA
jgi:hypothetical protein